MEQQEEEKVLLMPTQIKNVWGTRTFSCSIVPAQGSSNIDVFITNNVTATFEFWPGDDIWIEFRGKTLTEEVLQLLSQ